MTLECLLSGGLAFWCVVLVEEAIHCFGLVGELGLDISGNDSGCKRFQY